MNDYYWEGCGWNMTGGSNNSVECPSCEDTSVTTICECNSDCSVSIVNTRLPVFFPHEKF